MVVSHDTRAVRHKLCPIRLLQGNGLISPAALRAQRSIVMTSHIYRPEHKHPEPYQQDLNPDASKGLNWGLAGPHPEKDEPRTAFDVKEVHRWLSDFPDEDLQRLPLMPAGARLEANATYVNLADRKRSEFTAEGSENVATGEYMVPKAEVDYQLWNRLLGVEEPERTGEQPKPR
jgi:hypothetical protein